MRYAIAAAFAIIPALAEAAQPYEGAWANQTADCSTPTDSNIRIAGRKYYSHEAECDITKADRSGGLYALAISCEGEGEKWSDIVVVAPQGNRMLIGGANGKPLIRCPASQRPPN